MEEDIEFTERDLVEKYREAIRYSREWKREQIDKLRETIRNETRPVTLQEEQEQLEKNVKTLIELDERTRHDYYYDIERLDRIVNKYFLRSVDHELSVGEQRILDRALELRRGLMEIARQNMDIIYDDRKSRTTPVPKPTPEKDEEERKKGDPSKKKEEPNADVQVQISELKIKIEVLIAKISEIKSRLIRHETASYNELIIMISEEMKSLEEEIKKIFGELDGLKVTASNENISATIKELNKKLEEIKAEIRKIKIQQIADYNLKVEEINKRIAILKALTGLNEEMLKAIEALSMLSLCDYRIRTYRDINYIKLLDYDKLEEILKKLEEIEGKLNTDKVNKAEVEIQALIDHINNEIDKANTLEELNLIEGEIVELTVKVKGSTEISEEAREKFLYQIKELTNKLEKKREGLGKDKEVENPYNAYVEELWNIMNEINVVDSLLTAHFAEASEQSIDEYLAQLEKCGKKLDDLEEEIKKVHEEKKLDDTQYENLEKKVKEVRARKEEVEKRAKNPVMIKDMDFWAFITGEIAGLSMALDKLEETVDNLEKPIKDKETRKKIDKDIATIEKEIKFNRAYLEEHKDENEEKYNETVAKLDELEDRLDKVSKKYRQKCPFLVRTAKSAKAFYKKHPKAVLFAAGLATVAILHATVGPIIIPAIMHGNIMIANKSAFLRPLFTGINQALGGLINAQKINGIWTLANGVRINPFCASTSLLKGLAISGMGTAALVAPVIAGIKKLTEKMNLKKLKSKAKEKYHDVKGKVKDKVQAIKDKREKRKEEPEEEIIDIKTKDTKKNKNSIDKEKLKEISKLLKEYQKSGLTFEEFVEANNLSEVDAEILRAFIPREEEETKGASR